MISAFFESLAAENLGRGGRHLLPEALDRGCWTRLEATPFGATRLAELRLATEALAPAPIPLLPFGSFMRFYRDGDRSEYEALYFRRRERLKLLALDLLAGGQPSRASLLDELLWAICDEYSWCLPAHIPAPPETWPGRAAEGSDAARGFVDLFAAETAFSLAEVAMLLGPRLSPEVLARVSREVEERVISHFEAEGPSFWWETARHNWAAVCAGGVGGAALWLVDEPGRLLKILRRLGTAFDFYLNGFPADGSCLEGLGYWTYGFGYFLSFAELLRERSLGAADLLRLPALRSTLAEIARFPERARLDGEIGLCFSDALRPYRYPSGFLSRLAQRFEGLHLPPLDLAEELSYDPCHRWPKALRDFVWTEPATAAVSPASPGEKSRFHWFPQAQWAICRGRRGTPFFAAKGGLNDEPHNHNDCGSFMLGLDGEVFLEDFGAPRYERDYFGPARYGYFIASSLGHSLPVLAGRQQSAGTRFRCENASFEERVRIGEGGFRLTLELARAYDIDWLRSFKRSFDLDPDRRVFLSLEDRFTIAEGLRPAHPELRERFVTFLPAETQGESCVSLKGRAGELSIEGRSRPARIEIATRRLELHSGSPLDATIVDFVYLSEGDTPSFIFDFFFLD